MSNCLQCDWGLRQSYISSRQAKLAAFRGVARGGPGGQSPSRSEYGRPYLNHEGHIVPLALLPAPSDSKSYLHLCFCSASSADATTFVFVLLLKYTLVQKRVYSVHYQGAVYSALCRAV